MLDINNIICYFQEVPPVSNAVSLRAKHFLESLLKTKKASALKIVVFTNTKVINDEKNVEYKEIPGKNCDLTLIKRLIQELKASIYMFVNVLMHKKKSVFIISTPSYIIALMMSIACRLSKSPYVLDVRDSYPEAYINSGLMKDDTILAKLLYRLSNKMYKNSALVFTATNGLKNNIEKHNKNTLNVYNGYPEYIQNMKIEKYKNFTICFHGVLGLLQDIKGLIQLTEILNEYDIKVIVIGYGAKIDLIKSVKIRNLRYLGRMNHAQLMSEISKCHLGISLRVDGALSLNSFPVKIWEYIGLGIPSIVTPYSEAGHFIESNKCGLQFKASDIKGVSDVILKMREDPIMYNSFVENCYRIRGAYTREELAKKFSNKIFDIINI